jgi:hypothetical protein
METDVTSALRPTLFSDPDDFYAQHPRTAELVDNAAAELCRAHGIRGQELQQALAAAESYTLRANAAFAEYLHADPRHLLPLMRLAVDAIAHHSICGQSAAPAAAGGEEVSAV